MGGAPRLLVLDQSGNLDLRWGSATDGSDPTSRFVDRSSAPVGLLAFTVAGAGRPLHSSLSRVYAAPQGPVTASTHTKEGVMTDGCIARRIRVRPVVLALLAAGLLAAIVFLGAPATSSAAQPTYTCFNLDTGQSVSGVPPGARHKYEQAGFNCKKS